LQALWFSKVYW